MIVRLRGCWSLNLYVNIFNVQRVLKLLHYIMKEDETERESLSVIWRGVTDHWPTHSSTHAGMLLLQIAPIDPLTFCLQSSSKVSAVWIIQTWWEFKIQSMHLELNNVLWNTWLSCNATEAAQIWILHVHNSIWRKHGPIGISISLSSLKYYICLKIFEVWAKQNIASEPISFLFSDR